MRQNTTVTFAMRDLYELKYIHVSFARRRFQRAWSTIPGHRERAVFTMRIFAAKYSMNRFAAAGVGA
jgi:hypothetical protein